MVPETEDERAGHRCAEYSAALSPRSRPTKTQPGNRSDGYNACHKKATPERELYSELRVGDPMNKHDDEVRQHYGGG